MEIRIWNETGDLVGHCKVDGTVVHFFPEFEGAYGAAQSHVKGEFVIPFATEELAVANARHICEQWKGQAEKAFEEMHGEKPVGVMSETGFTIQEVED